MCSIVTRLLPFLLATGLLGTGCRKADAPPPLGSGQTNQGKAAPSTGTSPQPKPDLAAHTNSVEQRVTQLLDAFQTAPETTRTRVQSAVATIQAGNEKEGVVQLKLVDADSDLTAEQVQSIKDLITTIRKKQE